MKFQHLILILLFYTLNTSCSTENYNELAQGTWQLQELEISGEIENVFPGGETFVTDFTAEATEKNFDWVIEEPNISFAGAYVLVTTISLGSIIEKETDVVTQVFEGTYSIADKNLFVEDENGTDVYSIDALNSRAFRLSISRIDTIISADKTQFRNSEISYSFAR